MKKFLALLSAVLIFLVVGCGNMGNGDGESDHADASVLDLSQPVHPPADFAGKRVLVDQTIGINEGDRIGIVGRNGDGKSTLLDLIAQRIEADGGNVTVRGGVSVGLLAQDDAFSDDETVSHAVVGDVPDYVWASDPRVRPIIDELLADVATTASSVLTTDATVPARPAPMPNACWQKPVT